MTTTDRAAAMVQHTQEQLVLAMRRAGVTQAQLAEAAGVQQATVSRYLSGADIKMSVLATLADAMGLEWRGFNDLHLVPKEQ